MKLKIYQIDAFADRLFGGNPAAVCPLDTWLPDDLLQNIAMENNLAETAFYVKEGNVYHIKWFTPTVEVDLCGHATLAAAYVIFNIEKNEDKIILFHSHKSGDLAVSQNGEDITLNFPSDEFCTLALTEDLTKAFQIKPHLAFRGKSDIMFIFESEEQIRSLHPNIVELNKLDCRGVIVTAKGNDVDFVSRFFAPQSGIEEDPVTGSAHTTLTPYWALQLNKQDLAAVQLSERGGYLKCRYLGERVEISGQAKLYMIGEIFVE